MSRRICLMYPPLSVNEFPHLALPLLKSYLCSHNIQVEIKDFNAPIMSNIIKSRLPRIEEYFQSKGVKMPLSKIERDIEYSYEILADREDRGKDERAFRLINTYLKIAGSNISEICFSPKSLRDIANRYYRNDYELKADRIETYIKETIIPYFSHGETEIVGISIPFGSQIYYALAIGRALKKRYKHMKVFLGGAQVSMFWKNIIENVAFRESYDALIPGSGETAVLEYINCVMSGGNLKEVSNLVYFNASNVPMKNENAPLVSIHDLPIPQFEGFDLNQYAYPKLPYFFTRGCYWGRCTFCSYRDVKGYTCKKSDKVVSDIRSLQDKYKVRHFHFIDDAIHPKIMEDISLRILEEKLKIKYESYLRLDPEFTKEIAQIMAQSGMRSALFGLESGNDRILNEMNKGIHLDTAKDVLKNMKSAGIQAVVSCIIGFPGETREEAMDSVEYLLKIKDLYSQVFLVHYGLISDMYMNKEKYGIYDIDFSNPVRYDNSGFVAFGYPYRTRLGMEEWEAYELIEYAEQQLGIKKFKDSFFS